MYVLTARVQSQYHVRKTAVPATTCWDAVRTCCRSRANRLACALRCSHALRPGGHATKTWPAAPAPRAAQSRAFARHRWRWSAAMCWWRARSPNPTRSPGSGGLVALLLVAAGAIFLLARRRRRQHDGSSVTVSGSASDRRTPVAVCAGHLTAHTVAVPSDGCMDAHQCGTSMSASAKHVVNDAIMTVCQFYRVCHRH